MPHKGYGFVREPGISTKTKSLTPEVSMSHTDIAQPEEDARSRLARHHETMVALWGSGYEKDPRYQQALSDVEKGRHPTNVLADFRGF